MLSKIFNGKYLQRLDNIIQWQEKDVFKQESVSQHSYKVTIFARVLLEDIFSLSNNPKVNMFKLDVTTRALFHDWDETLILRDMSHETKYNEFNGEEIRTALNRLAQEKAKTEFREADEDGTWTDSMNMMVYTICVPVEPVKSFAKLCDWMALFFYMRREKLIGNKDFRNSWEIVASKFPKAIEEVEKQLKEHFPNEVMDFTELNNLKTIFEDYE